MKQIYMYTIVRRKHEMMYYYTGSSIQKFRKFIEHMH